MVSDRQITRIEKAVDEILKTDKEGLRILRLGVAGCENQVMHSRSLSRDVNGKPCIDIQSWGPAGDIMPGLIPIEEKHIPAMDDFSDLENEFHVTTFNWGEPDPEAYEAYRKKLIEAYNCIENP